MKNETNHNINNSCQGNIVDEIRSEIRSTESRQNVSRQNPRLVFANPDHFFGVDYYDLLLEQQEGM